MKTKDKGFDYEVTPEQIADYKTWTIEEKFEWLESISQFIYNLQTPLERNRMRILKGKLPIPED